MATQAEVEMEMRMAELAEKRKLLREEAEQVKRDASSMRNVSFTLNKDIYLDLQAKAAIDSCTVTQILRGAAIAYIYGELKLDKGKLVTTQEKVHNTPGTMVLEVLEKVEKKKTGPKTSIYKEEPPPPPELPKRKAIPRKRLESYYIPVEHDLSLDERPHLKFSTTCDFEIESGLSNVEKIRYTSFGHICESEYQEARAKCDDRQWILQYPKFIGHCAGMFFKHSHRGSELRFEPTSLEHDVNKLHSEQEWMVEGWAKWKSTQEDILYED